MIELLLIGTQNAPTGQSGFFWIGWFGLMILAFYYLIIRPQQKRDKERREMIQGVKTGEKVVFSGGIIGTVTNTKDKTIMIKIADNTKVEVLRGAIIQRLPKGEDFSDDVLENK